LDVQKDPHSEQFADVPACAYGGMHVTDERGQLATYRFVIAPALIYHQRLDPGAQHLHWHNLSSRVIASDRD
jgi:hypothetical protein